MKELWWCWNLAGNNISIIGIIDDKYKPDVTVSELALIKFLVEDHGYQSSKTQSKVRPLIDNLLAVFPL